MSSSLDSKDDSSEDLYCNRCDGYTGSTQVRLQSYIVGVNTREVEQLLGDDSDKDPIMAPDNMFILCKNCYQTFKQDFMNKKDQRQQQRSCRTGIMTIQKREESRPCHRCGVVGRDWEEYLIAHRDFSKTLGTESIVLIFCGYCTVAFEDWFIPYESSKNDSSENNSIQPYSNNHKV